jgi:hypothetical protein
MWNLAVLESTSMDFTPNSTPMVAFDSKLNLLCVYRERTVAVLECENFSTLMKEKKRPATHGYYEDIRGQHM